MSATADSHRPAARTIWAIVVGLAFVLSATAVRAWLGQVFPDLGIFGLYYPAILAAALLGGWAPAILALVASLLLGWYFFQAGGELGATSSSAVVNLVIFTTSGALVAAVGARLETLLRRRRIGLARLAERELRYRTLFESVSDGFALVRAIRDEHGLLVDYTVLEANPALMRLLGVNGSIIGRRQSDILNHPTATWLEACDSALRGPPVTFEYSAPEAHRWFEIHLSRVGEDQLAQFVVDVTARKIAEARQHELFDELNHRVKNNLAMVSAVLGMQARMTDHPKVRHDLEKAVDRIQTIADVHTTLYRSSSKDDVDFAAYLYDLCERLSGSLLVDDRVRIELAAEPTQLPLDRAVALGVIVNELVTNAAKHAYPPPARGTIHVELRHIGGRLELSVADTGCGLLPHAGPKKGLGMRLIRSLVQQLDGTLDVGGGGGARFTIRMPLPTILHLSEAQSRLL